MVSQATLFLSDADVRRAFDWKDAVAALRRAYAAPQSDAMIPPRAMARGSGQWLRTLSGVVPEACIMGAKMIAYSTSDRRASYLIPLFDARSVELLALLDGHSITGFRTAATSALAADILAPERALRVAVLGSGFEARNHVRAMAAVRAVETLNVYSPNPASRQAFIDDLSDLGIAMGSVGSAREAIEGADLIFCAARAKNEEPILRGEWLQPGATIVSIGSTLPEQREIDPEAIARADVIAADMVEEVAHDTGDFIAAKAAGVGFMHKLVPLADIVGGAVPGRTRDDQIMLYKSVGSALQDLTVANMCFARAADMSLGSRLADTIHPVQK
jgi:ornithine cyclodeaminase/alanine dehydrogenase